MIQPERWGMIPSAVVPGTLRLSEEITSLLTELIAQMAKAHLTSAAIFGSAAEGRMRPSSDLNLMCVFSRIEPSLYDSIRECLQEGSLLCRLRIMFLLESELKEHAALFPMKFLDIKRRSCTIYGPDLTASIAVENERLALRVLQVLANLRTRSRAVLAAQGSSAARLNAAIADSAGPMRTAAAAILHLSGRAVQGREAFEELAKEEGRPELALALSRAREKADLKVQEARAVYSGIGELAEKLYARAKAYDGR